MAKTQQALLLPTKQGRLTLGTRPIPHPGPGEVLVKVQAVSLNHIDWKVHQLGLDVVKEYPVVLGADVAGDVVGVGEGGSFEKGDRIFFQGAPGFGINYGAYQEYVIASADIAAKIPKDLSYTQAAGVPLAFTTAAVGLFAEKPHGAGLNPTWDITLKYPTKTALVIGGSTCVGQYAIQLLKLAGFKRIIVYASSKHQENLTKLGATMFIDRDASSGFAAAASALGPDKLEFDIVYDCVGTKETLKAAYTCLTEDGQVISVSPVPEDIAGTAKAEVEAEVGEIEGTRKRVFNVWGTSRPPFVREFGKVMYERLPRLLESGKILPLGIEVLPNGLNGIPDGLERLKDGKSGGKKLVAKP